MMAAGWTVPPGNAPGFPRKDGWSNTRGCTRPSDRRMSHNLKLPMMRFYRLFFLSLIAGQRAAAQADFSLRP